MNQKMRINRVDIPEEPTCREDIPSCICKQEPNQQRIIGVYQWGTFCNTCGGRV